MALDRITLAALRRLPKNFVSRAFGVVCEVELPPPMQKVVNETFARMTRIDVREGERMPADYPTLNAFFTRHLQAGARPVASEEPTVLVSPVDGRLGQFGKITDDTLIQAKGREYKLVDLVDSGLEAREFKDGFFVTLYLSPRDYHRIHSPSAGRVEKVSYIPGHLFPVNLFAVENVDELFAVNERLITYVSTEAAGRIAVIKVGATCVGRIGLAFDEFCTNQRLRRREEFELDEPVDVAHGDELGVFNLGSTVILLISHPDFGIDPDLASGEMLRVGQFLGRITS
ncbi:MAG: archaetidylserine decarboxylase [Bradymonadaceae bacterium]